MKVNSDESTVDSVQLGSTRSLPLEYRGYDHSSYWYMMYTKTIKKEDCQRSFCLFSLEAVFCQTLLITVYKMRDVTRGHLLRRSRSINLINLINLNNLIWYKELVFASAWPRPTQSSLVPIHPTYYIIAEQDLAVSAERGLLVTNTCSLYQVSSTHNPHKTELFIDFWKFSFLAN